MPEQMPVMSHPSIKSMPMAMLEPFRRQAMKNHGQTLERLAERGGLCASEVLSIMDGIGWGRVKNCPENDALLVRRIEAWGKR